ncbi:phage tail protein [Paenibacillus roseipurpureus]|uniref:Phage tail protein n=1 Tax=Paenibacillus roseopurpureus TaxID=2918901 RepID=A0AA96LP47_9BACL|nr:phage tail protein [Paenibacillus sp. MBLB1832]WNR44081.1 phage tail protein [Paenibacillus sp. MBLB1832]
MGDGQTFFSLNKPMDWEQGYDANIHMDEHGFSIAQTEKYSIHRIVRTDELEGIPPIQDMTVGPGRKLILLDESANVWVYDDESRHRELLFRRGHELFSPGAQLASMGDLLIIADASEGIERRLALYSISNGQTMWATQEWEGLSLYPLSVNAKLKTVNTLYITVPLDITVGMNGSPEVPKDGRIGIIQWNSAGEVTRVFEHEALRMTEATPISKLQGRYYTAAADGTLALLDTQLRTVSVFHEDGREPLHFPLEQEGRFAGISIDTNHNLYIGDSGYAQQEGVTERFILKYRGNGESLDKVTGFRGRTDKLVQDGRNRLYVFDRMSGQISLLDLRSRTMLLEDTQLPEAVYFSSELDTTETETVWHKIRLEADIPEETQIRFSYFASDESEGEIDGHYLNYSSYFTDPSITAREKLRATRDLWSEPILNPKDALLMNAQGRYLWFKIELVGSEQTSPFIRKLRVYYPRTSLISYLPPMYQQDEEHSPFLERFLAMFSTFFDDMEDKIDRISAHFDPDAVSGTYLEWLGGWLAITEHEAWGERKLRELIKRAPELYKLRGTREGLIRMLQIYTGSEPFVLEYFQFKMMQETSELRKLFAQLYGDNPYTFCVLLKPESVRTDAQRLIIEHIIEDQKPAYTEGKLIVLQPWMYADMHTYLGINTYLSEPTLLTLDQRSSMPYNTVLIDVDRDKRMDIHTRLGLDSEIE